jgi:hypothetical protein
MRREFVTMREDASDIGCREESSATLNPCNLVAKTIGRATLYLYMVEEAIFSEEGRSSLPYYAIQYWPMAVTHWAWAPNPFADVWMCPLWAWAYGSRASDPSLFTSGIWLAMWFTC